jgi:hypothetical protein
VVGTAPGLPVTALRRGVHTCGLLLGTVIRDGTLLAGEPLALPDGGDSPLADAERLLASLGGRHVAVLDLPGHRRLYPDAMATRAVVYSPALRAAGSTPLALYLEPDVYDTCYERDLAATIGMPAADQWYPGALTPHRGVMRLLPNHYLDLDSWSAIRHWGSEPPPPCQPEQAVSEIGAIVRGQLSAVAARQGLHLSLTAGKDSRLLLACAREIVERIEFFTFVFDADSEDTRIATLLARRLGLRARLLPVVRATPEQSDAFLRRTGHAVSGAIREIHPTLAQLNPTRMVLPALGGEVGRAYYWRPHDNRKTPLSPSGLTARLRLPHHPRIVAAVADWLTGLRDLPTRFVLDLALLELRLGGWAGPQTYGSDPFGDTLIPLAQRRVFELMMGLPEDYRTRDLLVSDVCRQLWPELLSLPFNRLTGWLRIRKGLARRIQLLRG